MPETNLPSGEKKKKVFVSGCFDLLHPGHVAFFENAAKFGEVYVSVGSDRTIEGLKHKKPSINEKERLYMVKSLAFVKDAWIGSGTGILDFEPEIRFAKPDIFIVNEDGDTPEKRALCDKLEVQYVVQQRKPKEGLPERSTTQLSRGSFPYRIDLAGGWLDQPFVSSLHPGPVIVFSIHPTHEFDLRSGMATSTRERAFKLFNNKFPEEDFDKWAEVLFAYDNLPGKDFISGSQDSYGIMLPGINKLNYSGKYLPDSAEHLDKEFCGWLEQKIKLVRLGSREKEYNVLKDTNINRENAKALADAAESAWSAIKSKNTEELGKAVKQSFEAQLKMFPRMANKRIFDTIEKYKDLAYGWKLSGAGGEGYLTMVSDREIPEAVKIKIRSS